MIGKMKFLVPCLIAGMVAFTGCSDDDKNGGPTGEALSSEQSKEKLSEIGQNLIKLVNAQDQEKLIKLGDYFSQIATSLVLQEKDYNVQQLVRSMVMASNGDMGKVYGMTSANGEIYQVSDCYGVYTYQPDGDTWSYEESDSELALHFTYQNQNAIIRVAASGSEVDFNYDNDVIKVPAKVAATIKLGETTLTSFEINTANVSSTPRKANINVAIDASGYRVSSSVYAGPDAVTASYIISIKGQEAIKGEAYLNGNNITADPVENEDVNGRFKDARIEVNIMGEAFVALQCSNYKKICDEIDRIDEKYDNEAGVWGESQAAAQEFADAYKKYLSGGLKFAGSDVESAMLTFQPYLYYTSSYNKTEYWDVEPLLQFQDESLISFEDFFDDASGPMKSLIDSFEALVRSFEGFFE